MGPAAAFYKSAATKHLATIAAAYATDAVPAISVGYSATTNAAIALPATTAACVNARVPAPSSIHPAVRCEWPIS